MEGKCYIRDSVPADIAYLAPKLREIDKFELEAAGFSDGFAALTTGLEESEVCFTVLSPDTRLPMAMFGVVLNECGEWNTVWLLGTDEIKEHLMKFARYSKRWVDLLANQYGPIGNAVAPSNGLSQSWLEWCGFSFMETIYADGGHPMLLYMREE